MALITCPDCGKSVSDQAASCPHCAHPFQSRYAVQPIEKTGKQFKSAIVLGPIVSIFGGIFASAVGADFPFIVLIFILGFGISCAGKVGAWWYHG